MSEVNEFQQQIYLKRMHVGNNSFEELRRLKQLHAVCLENFIELDRVHSQFSDYNYANQIFVSGGIEPAVFSFVRVCYNYLSAVIARKELFFAFRSRFENLAIDFGKSRLDEYSDTICFVETMRNILIHSNVPEFRLFCEITPGERRSGFAIPEKYVINYIRKKVSGEKQKAAINCAVSNARGGEIELIKPLTDYNNVMGHHYVEFFDLVFQAHKKHYSDYHEHLKKLGITL